jgi:hypothetical protein
MGQSPPKKGWWTKIQFRKEEVVFALLHVGHCTLNWSLNLVDKHANGFCLIDETVKKSFVDSLL